MLSTELHLSMNFIYSVFGIRGIEMIAISVLMLMDYLRGRETFLNVIKCIYIGCKILTNS